MKKMKSAKIVVFLLTTVFLAGFFAVPSKAEEEKLTGKTAMEITQMMEKGWNLGNTFDATGGDPNNLYSQETSWGNPIVTKELIDGVRAAGFTTIRIPVTWNNHIDESNGYQIEEAFLNRINEVVDYAFDNDMFVILNTHHEEWVNDKNIHENYEEIGKELNAVWSQLADRFAEYDQHLIFEGMNEPRAVGMGYEWTGNQACYDAVNYLDQVFVDCIRSNGKGYNAERALMVPGYAASSNPTVLNSIQIPQYNGKDAENVIISVHCYSPYSFCLTDEQESFNPNNSQDTADITSLINNIKNLFLNHGIPVVMGECGATNTRDNVDARKSWFTFIGDITRENGIPAIVWDNGAKGNSGGECHNYFVRETGEQAYPELISAFIYGDPEANKPKDIFIDFEPYEEGGTTVLATPEQYGFTPKTLTKKAKINHSKDANVGFSAVIPNSEKNSYTTMDLSKFAGKTINVKLYLKSESQGTVTLGILENESRDMVTAQLDTAWTQITFSYQFGEDPCERALFFQGDGVDVFYIDDISITIVEAKDQYETQILKEGETAETTETPAAGESVEDDSVIGSADSETTILLSNPSSNEGGNTYKIIIIVCIIIILVGLTVAITFIVKKKAGKTQKNR